MGTMQQKMGQGVFALARPSYPSPYAPPPAPVVPRLQEPNGDCVEYTDKVVESAVQQAVDRQDWLTAYALRTIYDDHRQNKRMVQLIDQIYTQTACPDQIREFQGVMKYKKKEGKKDGAAEYFFCGDGSDPAPQTHSSATNAHLSTNSTPSVRSSSAARTMADAQVRQASCALSSVSTSPHPDNEQHINKKRRGNDLALVNVNVNGNGVQSEVNEKAPRKQPHGQKNGRLHLTSRGCSMSSSSSLSSVDEHVLDDGEYTSPSGLPRGSQRETAGLAEAQHRPTPCTNAKISVSAETHACSEAHNLPGPIKAPTTKGPKTYTFSTVTTPSPSLSSSTNNHANTSHRPTSSANKSMAPAALLPSAPLSSSSHQEPTSIIFKTKKDLNKVSALLSHDENDSSSTTTGRMKREARKVTEKNTSTAESFERDRERQKISLPLLQEPESASDGGESVTPKRATKLRLNHNNKKATRQAVFNYDSDSLSSPTALSFAPDIAPGSLSVSRAHTPNKLNRPTRKAKTGTGLRVKTS
jgi:hypothetical protein